MSLQLSTADIEPDEVTEAELHGIAELRARILKAQGRDVPLPEQETHFRRAILLRFLRARRSVKKPLEASTQMFLDMLEWYYTTYGFEAQVHAWQQDHSPEANLVRHYWPCGLHGKDKRGVPVYYCRLGGVDIAGIEREASFDHFIRHICYCQILEELGMNEAAVRNGKHPVKSVCIIDLRGLEWGRTRRSIASFNKSCAMLDAYFPERLFVALVVRAPWIFSAIYKLISPALDAGTRDKVQILGSSADHLGEISKYIDLDQVPDWLGGTSTGSEVPKGGTVPNSKKAPTRTSGDVAPYYPEELRDDGFTAACITAGKVEDIEFPVEAGARLTYSVKIESYDVDFSVVLAAQDGEWVLVANTRLSPEAGDYALTGTVTAEMAGSVRLRFDNSYSWARSKTVLYKLE